MTQYTIYDNDDSYIDHHETLIERLLSVGICLGTLIVLFIMVNIVVNYMITHLGLV
jgi:hypothetical protein